MKKIPALFIVTLLVLFFFSAPARTGYAPACLSGLCTCKPGPVPATQIVADEIDLVPVLLN